MKEEVRKNSIPSYYKIWKSLQENELKGKFQALEWYRKSKRGQNNQKWKLTLHVLNIRNSILSAPKLTKYPRNCLILESVTLIVKGMVTTPFSWKAEKVCYNQLASSRLPSEAGKQLTMYNNYIYNKNALGTLKIKTFLQYYDSLNLRIRSQCDGNNPRDLQVVKRDFYWLI